MKLFLLFVILPALCKAATDSTTGYETEDTDDTTEISRLVTMRPADRYKTTKEEVETTPSHQRQCVSILSSPKHLHTTFGSPASFKCTCLLYSIEKHECPEWRGIYDTPHTYTRILGQDFCIATLTIPNVTSATQPRLTCTDVMSSQTATSYIHYHGGSVGQRCDYDSDCEVPFQCVVYGPRNKTCSCPEREPIYSEGTCYPVSRLLSPCKKWVQCKAFDRNSYCMRSDVNNTGELYCLCGPGYELGNDGRCVCEDCGLNYVYRFSKRYQIIFYCLLTISIILILLGLLRICMVSRERNIRRPGVVLQARPEDSSPLTDVKEIKEKF